MNEAAPRAPQQPARQRRRTDPVEIRFRISSAPVREINSRTAEFLRLLMEFSRQDEAAGIRYLDEEGRELAPLPHGF